MTSRPPEYDNLVARGILKVAASNPDSIAQYVRTASELLADAKQSAISAHGRYLMAYEGLSSLAMVVAGTARGVHGDETLVLTENQSTYIPIGMKHRLENPGKVPLHLIEVQSAAIWTRTILCGSRIFNAGGELY